MSDPEPGLAGGIRDRYRAHVRDEVKRVALRQLADGGAPAVSINAIAKDLGVSGPALYRYFGSRDDLFTELIVDAYRDFTAAIAGATEVRRTPRRRLRALANAYRGWAIAQPHRYRLLFAAPMSGYDAHADALVAASVDAMSTLLDVLAEAAPTRQPGPLGRLDRQLNRWLRSRRLADVGPTLGGQAIIIWSRLHGLVSLEIEGNFASMGLDPTLLFERAVADLLPAP